MNLNKIVLNNVKNRFLPIPESASKGYEPEPQISDFEFIKELGTGTFGRVFLVYHKKTNVKYAIKAIDKRNKHNIEEKPYFHREVEIMYRLNHPNIVKLYGHFEDNDYCFFIMEYIPDGNIYSLIPKHGRQKQSNRIISSILKDVISAVYYLHNMDPPIIHRDIKPENVLMNGNRAVLTDFGWSNYLNESEERKTICGTPIYLAPEMISQRGHDGSVDIWCIGVLLFELVTGKVPFQGNNIDTLKKNIRNMNIAWPSDINYEAKDLISKILKYNPKDRLTAKEILNHMYIKKYFPNAVNDLILPDKNLNHKTFIVSIDDPQNWDPYSPEEELEEESNDYNYKTNKLIKRHHTSNFKIKINIKNPNYEKEKKNIINNSKYNFNTLNTYEKNKHIRYIKNNYKRNKESNKSYNNYERILKFEKNDENDENDNYDKYNDLLKQYDNLKTKYYLLQTNYSVELDILKRELKEKENKINQFKKNGKLYELSEREYRRKKKEIKELEILYDDLKIENHELKEKLNNYSNYLKEEEKVNYDNNFNEIRDSINGRNKIKFKMAMDKLRYDLDEDTQKYFYNIINEKEKQLQKCKEEAKMKRVKEKKEFSIIINKYDKALSWQEKENKDLKIRLQELERKLE